MIIPVFFLIVALVCALASVLTWGPVPSFPLLMSVLFGFAALALSLRAKRLELARNWIVVDGSNVMHWERETPDIRSVFHVIAALKAEGFVPLVWFDANAGYLIGDRYMGPTPLARLIDLPARQVYVAPKGTPADPLLLQDAVKLKSRVVTNDRFRDWAEQFPQIREEGFLVRGRMQKDAFELELGD